MPKVLISISERITYSREVEMTDAEYREWDEKTDRRGQAHDDALEELRAKYIRPEQDCQGADSLQLEDFSLVPD